jgi:hypothetical protein
MGNVMTNTFGQMMGQNASAPPPQGPPPLPAATFYVAVNGQQSGPFTYEQLSQMVSQGTLKQESLVWKQGMASWMQASGVADLAPLFANLPPPLPPV